MAPSLPHRTHAKTHIYEIMLTSNDIATLPTFRNTYPALNYPSFPLPSPLPPLSLSPSPPLSPLSLPPPPPPPLSHLSLSPPFSPLSPPPSPLPSLPLPLSSPSLPLPSPLPPLPPLTSVPLLHPLFSPLLPPIVHPSHRSHPHLLPPMSGAASQLRPPGSAV